MEGAAKSYLESLESIQRVHLVRHFGEQPLHAITVEKVDALVARLLKQGRSPKTVRNVLAFLHSIFELGMTREWCHANPVQRAVRPKGRRSVASAPDLQFLSLEELDAVLRAIPDDPARDHMGPMLRVLVLAAAMTGLRQSELLGLRWRDVDSTAHRLRVRSAYVRGEHSTRGKSDLSTRRSVPIADELGGELHRWSTRTAYAGADDLVFAHPHTGRALERSRLTRRFQDACRDAGVRVIRFHDLRHTFATRLAAAGTPLRTLQEFLGHAHIQTTQIHAHYAPSSQEVAIVNLAFERDGVQNGVQSEAK